MKTLPLLLLQAALAFSSPLLAEVTLTRSADRVRVEIDGQLFTEYIFAGANRPYCYPVLASDGTPLTRNYPMKEVPGEDPDHPHHRSLWFAHSDVNGVDFWNQDMNGSPRPKGKIVHDTLIDTASGATGTLRARNRWVAPDGRVFCTDERTVTFSQDGDHRVMDWVVTLQAPVDTLVELRDDKDGVMALRLAQWLNLARPPNSRRRFTGGVGHILTSAGKRDGEAWGTRATWCDYFAEQKGKIYGVAIFDHPQNLRHPTWWHARDYGLVAANPLGLHDFEPKNHPGEYAGNHTIPAGGSMTFRYRIIFHLGDPDAAKIAERYATYTAKK